MKAFSLVGECAEKSELVSRLVVELVGRGLTVSTIKRVSDAVDLERQGSGTWKHRAAGAAEVMIASASRFALLREMPPGATEPEVGNLLAPMAPVDIVLLDGFRRSNYPKMDSRARRTGPAPARLRRRYDTGRHLRCADRGGRSGPRAVDHRCIG